MKAIDLNCDLGELDDGSDLAIMPFVSSCNIACGGHAGNLKLMALAIDAALKYGVTIGAHPGYSDKVNFGRHSHDLSGDEVTALIVDQVGRLRNVVNDKGAKINYLKLHGALYHDAAKYPRIARSVIEGIKEFHGLNNILGPPNSTLEEVTIDNGMNYFNEGFIDRRYQENGWLVPRAETNAILNSVDEIERQLLDIVLTGVVKTGDGKSIRLKTDSICIHGDHLNSINTAQHINDILRQQKIRIKSFLD